METQVPVEANKIFVGGLSWETDEDKMKAYFQEFGVVLECKVMRDPNQDRSVKRHRGFGFVTFENAASITAVLSQSGHMIDNKSVDPKPATMKSSLGGGGGGGGIGGDRVKKCFLGGLSTDTTPDQIKQYFKDSGYGIVSDVDLKMDRGTQRMRGFGFATFESESIVEKVVETHFHQINGKSVEAKRAEPRNATPSGQAIQQMRQMTGATAGYPNYQQYAQGEYQATNGQAYQQQQQQYMQQTAAGYYYSTPQGQAAVAAAGYGQYGANTGYNYDTSGAYPRTQTSSGGDRQDTQASFYQQHGYGHGGAQQMPTSYGQDASSYTARSTGYATGQDGYGQQSGAYGRGSSQQQPRYGGTGAAGGYGAQ